MADVNVRLVVTLRNLATRGLKRLGGAITGIGRIALRAIKIVAVGAFAGLAAVITKATFAATGFQEVMAQVSTLIGDDIAPQFAGASDRILEMSKSLPQDQEDLGVGLYQILSAGVEGASNAFQVLEVAAKAAIAGGFGTTTEDAVRTVTGLMNSYGLEADQASRISDILFGTIKRGVITFPELAANMGEAATSAALAGVELEELAAAFATMTKFGISAAEASTSLNRIFLALSKQTPEQQKLFKDLGVDFSLAAVRAKGLDGVLRDLAEATGGNLDLLSELFDVRELRAAMIIAGRGSQEFADILNELTTQQGAAEEAFQKLQRTAAAQFRLFRNRLNVVMIRLGDILLEQIIPAMDEAAGVFETLEQRIKDNREIFVELGQVLRGIVRFIIGLIPRIFDFAEGLIALRRNIGPSLGVLKSFIGGLIEFGVGLTRTLLPVIREIVETVRERLLQGFTLLKTIVTELRVVFELWRTEIGLAVIFLASLVSGINDAVRLGLEVVGKVLVAFIKGLQSLKLDVRLTILAVAGEFDKLPARVKKAVGKTLLALSDLLLTGGTILQRLGFNVGEGQTVFAKGVELFRKGAAEVRAINEQTQKDMEDAILTAAETQAEIRNRLAAPPPTPTAPGEEEDGGPAAPIAAAAQAAQELNEELAKTPNFAMLVGQALQDQFGKATVSAQEFAKITAKSIGGAAESLTGAFEKTFAGFVDGSTTAAQAFQEAFLGSISGLASSFAKFYAAKGVAALGEGFLGNPKAFVAAAQFFAAAALFGALAGAIGAAAGGGGGGGGPGGAARDTEGDLGGRARGEATVVIEGSLLDLSDPRQEERFRAALETISDRRVTVRARR